MSKVPVLEPPPVVLPRASAKPSRATIVDSLLANSKTATILRDLPNPNRIQLARLATMSLDGKMVSVKAVTAPQNVSAFPWEAGIQFTPNSPGPTYTAMGKQYSTGSLYVRHTRLPHWATLNDLHERDFLFLTLGELLCWLYVELPLGSATYMIAAQIDGISNENWIGLSVEDAGGWRDVPHVLLSDGTGIAGLHTISPFDRPGPAGGCYFMRRTSSIVHIYAQSGAPINRGTRFSGFVITRL